MGGAFALIVFDTNKSALEPEQVIERIFPLKIVSQSM